MEFTNEIFFNKKLIQNETILITYSGKLYKEYSAEITIVYGFGENWDYTSETKMQEKENGFEATINLKNYDTFNFCFKNNYNIWDNNSGFNYIASIESAQIEAVQPSIENKTIENSNIEITDNIDDVSNKEAQISIDNVPSKENQSSIDDAFNDLLNSIMDFEAENTNENINLEKGFGLQSVDEIQETDFTSCDDIFEILYNELSKVETVNNKTQDIIKTSDTTQLENLLNEFSEKQEQKENTITSSDLDNLMDNILNSVIEEESNSNSINKIEKNASEKTYEISELPAIKQSSVEDFIDKCIDEAYYFFRNIWNGCKKIGILIKNKTQELLGEDDK